MLNRIVLGSVCGGSKADMDRVFGDCHLARRGEQVRDELLRFAWPTHVQRGDRGQLGLGVGADDADDVDDRLELAGVADKLAGQFGVLDGGVLRKQRADRLELSLPFDRLGELAFDTLASFVVCGQPRQIAARVALGGAPDPQRAFELSARGIGDDGSRWVRLDAATVELVDPPAFDAVLEAVFLAPAMPQDLDQPRSWELADCEEADLPPVLDADDDAANPSAPLAEVAQPAL